ncbi:MAG TPA: type II toxin-antitoxin system ParD family antitoxin [Humisphaera sp.]|nr:type II toxin-antitoxin system ParD family antitoxin [Humisphaera sp.]
MTLKLPGDIEKFIDEQVKSGEYASAQDVVCAGLRLLKTRAVSGPADDFHPGEWDRLLAEAETTDAMTLDDVIAKRRAERASAKAAQVNGVPSCTLGA